MIDKKEATEQVLAQIGYAYVDNKPMHRNTISAHITELQHEIAHYEAIAPQAHETEHVQRYLNKARAMLQKLQVAFSKLPLLLALLFFSLHSCASQPTPTAQQVAIGETVTRSTRRPCIECIYTERIRRADSATVQYIKAVAPIAVAMEAKHGVPAGFAIAVAIYESGGGQSSIAQNANNHFGMRYFTCGGEFQYIDSPRPYRCQKGRLWQRFHTVADAYDAFAQTRAISIIKAENLAYTAENFAGTGYGGRKEAKRYARHLQSIIVRYNLLDL